MKYLLLINASEADEDKMSEARMGEILEGYGKFTEELIASGALVDSNRLQPSTTATTVRVRNGKEAITDGPFAETKEQIGGYYLVDVANLDEAIAWAKKIPSVDYGSIEVRPIWEMEG